jgi:hypothetical protein
MPLTTLYGDGTRIVGDANALEQTLHPTVMAYINIMQSPTGGNYAMSVNEIDAVNNMVQALVANGIFSKMNALYPIIGGTAAAHKFNLIDPRDADAAYRLSFLGGGWTHSANGATPNGTTSYANTFLNPNSALTLSSNHLSYYSRTASNISIVYDCGSSGNVGTATNQFTIFLRRTLDNTSGFDSGNATTSRAFTNTIPSSLGFFVGSKISNSDRRLFYNGVLRGTNTASDTTTLSTRTVYIGAINSGGPFFYGNRQCAFFSIGGGLTEAEAKALSTIVQEFQTKLGRQV